MNVWPPGRWSGHVIKERVLSSAFDVVILRYPSQDVETAAQLLAPQWEFWQADTLMYFEAPTASRQPSPLLVRLRGDAGKTCESLVSRVFTNYRNHYSSNPLLSSIDVLAAYKDWASRALSSDDGAVYAFTDPSGAALGISVIDTSNEEFDEVLLAGVSPENQGRGVYTAMMRDCLAASGARGKASVTISTQSSNIAVMRSWCRLGLLPIASLNTVHAVRAALLD
jgi:ribosomal protein S18 acetylase RimI-like enzyme